MKKKKLKKKLRSLNNQLKDLREGFIQISQIQDKKIEKLNFQLNETETELIRLIELIKKNNQLEANLIKMIDSKNDTLLELMQNKHDRCIANLVDMINKEIDTELKPIKKNLALSAQKIIEERNAMLHYISNNYVKIEKDEHIHSTEKN